MKYLLVLLCLSLTSCIVAGKMQKDHVEIIGKLTDSYIKKTVKQGGFYLVSHGGAMVGDIQIVSLGFDTLLKVNLDEARKIIVEKEAELLALINADREVRPYLHTYPFGVEGVEVSIGFVNKEGFGISPPNIAFVAVVRGNIYYSIYNASIPRLETIFSEPYEEAYRIVYGKEWSLESRAGACES